MLLWITILVFFNLHCIRAGYKGSSITCECTTTHCVEHNMRQCNTTSVCFSQYLDRHDGSHPVVRGCIKSKTPLLCENRRPAVARGAWPLLLCCNSNMCNRDVVPTPPPWFAASSDAGNDTAEEHKMDALQSKHNDSTDTNTILSPPSNGMFSFESTSHNLGGTPAKKKSRFSSLPHIISPIYISVLVLGIVSLVVIGIVAAIVLKRSNRYYVEQYGALEHQHCLKHNLPYPPTAQVQCDCDSEVESLSQCSQPYIQVESLSQCSQPYIQVVYPNRVSDDT